jgi:hypothetical protein
MSYPPINPIFPGGGQVHEDNSYLIKDQLSASIFNEYERVMTNIVTKLENGNDPGHFHTETAKGFWGQTTYNSLIGRLIKHDKNLPFYTVEVTTVTNPIMPIGDVWVDILNQNEFIVYNSGSNNVSTFRWTLKQLDIIEADISGSTIFASLPGKAVEHNYPFKDHILNVIPSQNPTGYLGDFWVNRSSIVDIVTNTGVGNSGFNYRLEILNDVEQWAIANFNGLSGVTIPHSLGTIDFDVFIIPEEDTSGYLGEVWVEKTNVDFTIFNSGIFTGRMIYYIAGLNSPTYFMRGRSQFASVSGKVIQHSLSHTNYDVLLQSVQPTNGYLGEVWVVKSNYFFTVYNSGSNNSAYFDYRVCLI